MHLWLVFFWNNYIHTTRFWIFFGQTLFKSEVLCPLYVGMGPSWLSIEHGHSGITSHLETAMYNVYETLNLRWIFIISIISILLTMRFWQALYFAQINLKKKLNFKLLKSPKEKKKSFALNFFKKRSFLSSFVIKNKIIGQYKLC